MKPAPFQYEAPDSVEAALDAMARHGFDAKLLAGGQSLIPVMNFRLAQPAVIVDINGLAELDFVRPESDGSLAIGAMTRLSRLERSTEAARISPLLADRAAVAHPQIRNRSTIGGTLSHADPAAEVPAVCLAEEAVVRVGKRGGERHVPAADFFQGLFATSLEPDEILLDVTLPAPSGRRGTSFQEIARRHGDYAMAGIAASLTLGDDGRVERARLVYLSVADRPFLATRAAAELVGEIPDEALLARAGEAAAAETEPAGTIHATPDYVRHLVRVLTRRALAEAVRRAGGEGAG